MGRISVGLLLAAIALQAQDVPAGWKVVKDTKGACQLAVPPDWAVDGSSAKSPDGNTDAVPHGQRAGLGFSEATGIAKSVMKPAKILEDSANRLWYTFENTNGKPGTNYYVAVATAPVCTAQVSFKNATAEDTAKKIAVTLGKAK